MLVVVAHRFGAKAGEEITREFTSPKNEVTLTCSSLYADRLNQTCGTLRMPLADETQWRSIDNAEEKWDYITIHERARDQQEESREETV